MIGIDTDHIAMVMAVVAPHLIRPGGDHKVYAPTY
jgi:hypothetical protein